MDDRQQPTQSRLRNQAGDFISYTECSKLKAAQEGIFGIPGEPAPKDGNPPPLAAPRPAVSDAERRASGEGWEQTPGTLTRQQTLNTSLLIQFHLHLQTIWQLLPTEVVTSHYGPFFNVASCLFTASPLLTLSPSSSTKTEKKDKSHLPAWPNGVCRCRESNAAVS